MPRYCYSSHGEVIERPFPMGEAKQWVRHNGKRFRRDIRAEHAGFRNTPANWPMHSQAMGVDVHLIPEAMEADKAAGAPIDYHPETGDAIYTTRDQRKRHCESLGVHDKNGGYGDPQRNARSDDDG